MRTFPLTSLVAFFSAAFFGAGLASSRIWAADEKNGEKLFLDHCAICHQPNGQGAPPIYPPLAESDFFAQKRAVVMKALCEGLSGEVTVKGVKYNNVMPAQMLRDDEAAAVLNYVGRSWGNQAAPFAAAEVAAARADSKFPTYEALAKAGSFAPLPPAPPGWNLREVAQLPEFCTRLAGNGKGQIFALGQLGTVYLVDVNQGAVSPIIRAAEYLDPARGDLVTMGMTQDAEGRLWIVSNQRLTGSIPYLNEIVIYRTTELAGGLPARPQPWLKTTYPYGIGSYNHGVSHMGFGPDGMLYVSSGSRTDGGEAGADDHYYQGAEVELTACLWRLDPKATAPKIEVAARGIRNAYSFAWDQEGRLFAVVNGPDASAPEPMDFIEPGKHYGFPYQFSNWPAKAGYPYPYTPKVPDGLRITGPVKNVGPDGGGSPNGLYTFDPHSSPAGLIWCGDDFAEPLRHKFLVARFGNLLGPPAAPVDVGFDVLTLAMKCKEGSSWETRTTKVIGPLGRPLDLIQSGPSAVLILEYTRPVSFRDQLGWLPGRILELAPAR